MLGGHGTPDNYNAQIASSLYVRESSKKTLMSDLDKGADCALKQHGPLSHWNFNESNLHLTGGL